MSPSGRPKGECPPERESAKGISVSRRIRTLVFPCGSENAAEIHQALRYSLHVELFGASSVEDHGRFRFEQYFGGLPNIADTGFDRAFAQLVAQLGIEVVFPTHDTVLEYLAPRASDLGVFLVNGDPRTAAVTRRKSTTYALFADAGWAPRVAPAIDAVDAWPTVVKPDRGQGGQGVTVAADRDQLVRAAATVQEPVFVEYLPGDEVTVDCFTDRRRRLLWVGPRTRERVKAGIAMRSTMFDATDDIRAIAATINGRLLLRGPWFFQLKRDRRGAWKLLEVCARVGGAMVAQRARGVNLPLLAIHDYLDRDVGVAPLAQVRRIERSIATRAELDYEYDTVVIDLDDTLVSAGTANPVIVAFLYQSVRDGKRIRLVTRHALDLEQTLRDARIAPGLFDEVIHLRDGASKAEHVPARSIFVDNHFPERADVAARAAVPVFDVDALEFFLR